MYRFSLCLYTKRTLSLCSAHRDLEIVTSGVKRKELEAVYSPSSVLESGKDATLVVGVQVVRWLCTSLNIGHLPSITTNSKLVTQREYEDGYMWQMVGGRGKQATEVEGWGKSYS